MLVNHTWPQTREFPIQYVPRATEYLDHLVQTQIRKPRFQIGPTNRTQDLGIQCKPIGNRRRLRVYSFAF